MLTLAMLNNASSSPVSSHKTSVRATDAQGAGQATDTAGFGKLLAHEMSGKPDVPEAGSEARPDAGLRDEKIVPDEASSDTVITTRGMETRNTEIQKDIKERETNSVAVSLVPQAMDITEMLPGLAAVRLPNAQIDTQTNIQADVPRDERRDSSAATLASASQAELASAVVQHAELAASQSQFSPVVARAAVAATGGGIDIEPVNGPIDRSAPRNTKLSSDVLANAAAAADVTDRMTARAKPASAM